MALFVRQSRGGNWDSVDGGTPEDLSFPADVVADVLDTGGETSVWEFADLDDPELKRLVAALHVVPHQFVRVEFRRIAGQEVQFQFAAARVDVVLHHLGLVGRQAVEDEKQRLLATAHDVAEHCYEQLGAHCALVRCKPEGAFGVDGGSRRYRLTGARHRNNRRAPFDAPGRALDHIGTKTGFIPEIDLGHTTFGPCRNARIGVALPRRDRLRVALVGAHQRFLRRQPQARQQLADRGQAELHAKLVGDQLGNDVPRPQTKIKAIPTRVPAVDPAEYLPRLLRCQFGRTAGALARAQRTQTPPATFHLVQPFVDRGATEAVGGDDGAGSLALPLAFAS